MLRQAVAAEPKPYARQLTEILAAVTFSHRRIYWFRDCIFSAARGTDPDSASVEEQMRRALQDCLYRRFYMSGGAVPLSRDAVGMGLDAPFASAIVEAANHPAIPVETRIRRNYSPGFMMIHAARQVDAPPPTSLRLYWNISSAAAARLVQMLTNALDSAGADYRLKIRNNPTGFNRADAAVLYLSSDCYDALFPGINDVHAAIARDLKREVPALTWQLGRGVGLAESPDDQGTSFGMHRAALLAEALVRARRIRNLDWRRRMAALEEVFGQHGLSLETPYLGAGGRRHYRTFSSRPLPPSPRLHGQRDPCRSVAALLSQQAVWAGDRCTWWRVNAGLTAQDGRLTSAPLRPDLYGGTIGIATYLAAYAARASDQKARLTAMGACRAAIEAITGGALAGCHGLYTGLAGSLLAAGLICRRLEMSAEFAQVEELAVGAAAALRPDGRASADLLSGLSGSAVAMSGLARLFASSRLASERLHQAAVMLGDAVLLAGRPAGGAISWANHDAPTRRDLTGLSHGAAGIALALIELYRETGDRRFLEGAQAGFRYERCTYDPALGNWPDYRMTYRHATTEARVRRAAIAWCHGAGGIAVSRMRAATALRDPALAEEVTSALALVRGWLDRAAESADGDLCLCHGFAGNLDILVDAQSGPFGERGDAARIRSAAAAVIGRLRNLTEHDPDTIDLSLMTGLTGVAYLLLRLKSPGRLCSVLQPLQQ